MKLKYKIQKLINFINTYNKVIVSYSGGLDSSLLAFLCKYLNKEVIAVTKISKLHKEKEIKFAEEFASKYKIKHVVIKTNELKNKEFSKNTPLRCYYCKRILYEQLNKLKRNWSFDVIFDGVNLDDIKNDFRPGVKAADEFKVKHPFVEVGITKKDIREIAKKFKLEIWDKLPTTCLLTRIPFGVSITEELLRKIEMAEEIIEKYWNSFFRIRDHNEIIRIELRKSEIKNFVSKHKLENLIKELKSLGYKFVTLDLEGYQPSGKRFKDLSSIYI